MHFVCYPYKARLNLLKHRVSFDEAASVFNDQHACTWADIAHSEEEERFGILGLSTQGRLLVVSYCWRGEDRIRLISARKALVSERQLYRRSNP